MIVGITKELMDATEGGSGFSFVDLMADRAGNLFTAAATRNAASARAMQRRIRNGVRMAEFFPDIGGLPEGISRDDFHTTYGGLGGWGHERWLRSSTGGSPPARVCGKPIPQRQHDPVWPNNRNKPSDFARIRISLAHYLAQPQVSDLPGASRSPESCSASVRRV